MNTWEIILLFFSFQSFLLSILFTLRKRGDHISNILLALFLFVFSYLIFFYVLFWSRFNENLFLDLYITDDIPMALLGPLFFLYIARTVGKRRINYKDLLHLIPLALAFIQYTPFYSLTRQRKAEAIANGEVMTIIHAIPNFSFFLSVMLLFYGMAAYIKYAKNYQNDPDLKFWLRAVSIFYLLFSLSNISYYILSFTSSLNPSSDYFITFSMVLFVGLVAYVAYMYPSIFDGHDINKVIPFVKYERTGLSSNYSLELKKQLEILMENEKPYLDSDMRMDDLAQMLDIPRHHASQVINEHFKSNFFDFINGYRVREAELALKELGEKMTIQKVAYQSGFNNRTSFYKAFKKVNGVTPSEYRNLNLAS